MLGFVVGTIALSPIDDGLLKSFNYIGELCAWNVENSLGLMVFPYLFINNFKKTFIRYGIGRAVMLIA